MHSGLLLSVVVHSADIQDRDGAALVLDKRTRRLFPFIERIYADHKGRCVTQKMETGYLSGFLTFRGSSAMFNAKPVAALESDRITTQGNKTRRAKIDADLGALESIRNRC